MDNVTGLRILEGGQLELGTLGVISPKELADRAGRILTDSGRTETVVGWGDLDGEVSILVDELGRDAYYVKKRAGVITTEAQYEKVKAKADALYAKGGRMRTLETRNLFLDDLTAAERAEFETLLAEYTELGRQMTEYNTPAMARALSQLNGTNFDY